MKSFVATLMLGLAAICNGVSAAEVSDAELIVLGQSYAEAINDLDADALDALISAPRLAIRIAEIAGDSPAEKRQLARSFESTIPTISRRFLAELERQGSTASLATFMRVHEFDGMRGPLVRYGVGDGYNYALLIPAEPSRDDREPRIEDLYFASAGELISETIGTATRLAGSPSETFLGKLFGTKQINRELVAQFKEINRLRQQNKLREAFDVLDGIDAPLRNSRLILTNTIQIAAQLDEGLYRQELRRLAAHHKDDPRAAFMLLDHYFYEKEFDSAMSVIDLMEQSYGSDAVMYLFRTNVELSRGRMDKAVDFARTSVQLEPDNEDAQWTLVTVLLEAGMFSETVEVLQLLANEFGYTFSRESLEAVPLYSEFVKSDEFARWLEAP